VGKALGKTFGYESGKESVHVYDKFLRSLNSPTNRAAIQTCDLVFVATPTPESPDGSCDISAVEDVVSWVEPPMCLKSTVPPGTVDWLVSKTGKQICFSPEYLGETPWHHSKMVETSGFVIVGGERPLCELVVRAYQQVLGPTGRYYMTSAKTAELCKYMVNTFLAMKVVFANEFYDLARAAGVSFDDLRELWLADERIGRSHTMVTEERGFGGRCFPKDIAAIIHWAKRWGGAPLLEAVDRCNDEVRRKAGEQGRQTTPTGPSAGRVESLAVP
jgi:nucleotide sugar dehydrogenase